MTPASNDWAIQTCGLSCSFGAIKAVDGLDLTIRKGEMFGLVGPDGAGKSTAIRLLCGILKPAGGTACVLGYDLVSDASRIKARIGYLSQNFTLYGDLSIDENIEFFADLHGVKGYKKRRDELLNFTRLTPFRKRLAAALSGGMKKKLALACTLIHTPEIIFLDEPSTGVDPVSRGEFWNILSGILHQGITIFMTTPYLDEAERCHCISLMHRGRIIMSGTPDTIKAAAPGRLYSLVSTDAASAYAVIRTRWPSTQVVLVGNQIYFWTGPEATDISVCLQYLADHGQSLTSHQQIKPTLEDAFIALLETQKVPATQAQ